MSSLIYENSYLFKVAKMNWVYIIILNTRPMKALSQAALQTCSWENVFWKYATNLQENTHAKVWFQ